MSDYFFGAESTIAMSLSPAAAAFDAVAERFDARYGAWKSVAAQRRAVRAALVAAFPPGARILEIGGGTGDDAEWLARQGREVLLTDVSPSMVRLATDKLRGLGLPAPLVASAEQLEAISGGVHGPFDGAVAYAAGWGSGVCSRHRGQSDAGSADRQLSDRPCRSDLSGAGHCARDSCRQSHARRSAADLDRAPRLTRFALHLVQLQGDNRL